MELALVLVVLVVVELFLTAFLLGRLRDFRREVSMCEKRMNDVVASKGGGADAPSEAVEAAASSAVVPENFKELLSKVTPEDVQQAQAILDAMGIKA